MSLVSRTLAVSILTLATTSLAHAATTWVSTATKAVSLQDATTLGAAPADMPLQILVGVKLRNATQLMDFIQSARTPGNPAFGHYLTTAQFVSGYSPTAAQAKTVADYLRSQGFRNVDVKPNRLLISATGTVAMVQAAFNTPLAMIKRTSGEIMRINTADAQVPSTLAPLVTGVLGLTTANVQHSIGPPAIRVGGLSPQQFWKYYNAASSPTGAGVAIAVFVSGDEGANMITSLHRYDDAFGLPPVWSKAIPVPALSPGQVLAPPNATSEGEWDMDAQASTGMAGDVSNLYIYEAATASILDATVSFSKFATDNVAKAGSASFGYCDGIASVLFSWNVITDPVLAQAVAQGQTLFASSGDVGPACPIPVVGAFLNGVPNGGVPLQQTYPASSQFVVAVGGTTLFFNNDGSYNFESAWDAGGGGPSTFERAPAWQNGIVPTSQIAGQDPGGVLTIVNDLASLVANFLFGGSSTVTVVGKGLPDISMDADFLLTPISYFTACASATDPNCGSSNGGTSLSSPLALGSWARIQGAAKASTGKCYGFAAPLFYALAPGQMQAALGFNDVTVGTNGGYPTTTGWDYATGLGSMNIGQLIGVLPPPTVDCGGSGGGGGNNPPVAALTGTTPTTGAVPLTVQFTGAASSDPDSGDSVASYVFHFGDGTPDVTQTTPTTSHQYTSAGTFVATLTVTDSFGAASIPAILSIVVTPSHDPDLRACSVPGVGVLSDPAFDNTVPNPGTDVLGLSVAEPYAANPADVRLVFTILTDPGRALQPFGSGWYVSFPSPHPDANNDLHVYGVRMIYRSSAPTFESYTASGSVDAGPGGASQTDGRFADTGTLVPADPNSNYDQKNGRITIIVKPADVGLLPGDVIAGFNASSIFTNDPEAQTGGFTETIDPMPDSLSYENAFAVYGNTFCPPAASPIARVTPTSLSFGAQALGVKSAVKTITYTNTWTQALPFNAVAVSPGTGEWVQSNNCPKTLPVGQSCTISVQFRPLQAGARTGTLTIYANNSRRQDTVALSGTGQ